MRRLDLHVFFVIVLTVVTSTIATAQIVDDSTQLVYGTNTVRVFYQEDIVNETDTTYFLDTLITGMEKVSVVERSRNYLQNLGNIGTAVNPIFRPVPEIIGRTSGYDAYQIYMPDPSKNRYYDTKSPFIDLFAQIGGQGRNKVDVEFTQNITEDWNFGINVGRITTDKQLGATRNEGDRNVINTNMDFHMVYEHPEIRYKVMGHLAFLNLDVREVGGAFFTDSSQRAEKFRYRDAVIRLSNAQTLERRSSIHTYQEYGLLEQFQLYHIFDRKTQTTTYLDNIDADIAGGYNPYTDFYPNFFIDEDSTFIQMEFSSLSNELGLKGTLGNVYYRFYARNRIVNHQYLYTNPFDQVVENYIGGESYFRWKEKFKVSVFGEFLQGGEFKFGGTLKSNFLEAGYQTVRYNQSFLAQRVFNNHYFWNNNFDPGLANELSGRLNIRYKSLTFKPAVELTTHSNFVYYDTASIARQANDATLMTRMGGHLNYVLHTNKSKGEGFHFQNELFYNTVTGNSSDFIRIPTFFYNGRVSWKGKWFEDAIPAEVGVNIHGKSSYFVYAYSPAIQQFHLQNMEKAQTFVTADLFLNLQIDKLYVFVKMIYANMPSEDGYFITYAYPGQERVFDLGVRWLFFD